MATRTITETDCDRCEKKNVTTKPIKVYTHWASDPAGGPSEDCGKYVDLCISCLSVFAARYIDDVARGEKKDNRLPAGANVFDKLGVKHPENLSNW